MAKIETIFISDNLHPVIKLEPLIENAEPKHISDREKIGNIYRTSPDHLLFVCTYCGDEFRLFMQFSVHIQKHLVQIHSTSLETGPKADYLLGGGADVKPLVSETIANDEFLDCCATDDVDDDAQCNESVDKSDDNDTKINNFNGICVKSAEKIVAEAEPEPPGVKCSICNRIFHSIYNLKRHKATHKLEKPFSCSMCDAKFSVKRNLHKHMIKRHNEKEIHDDERYHCEQCNINFTKKSLFEKHVNAHSSHPAWAEANKTYECYQCRDAFETSEACHDHLRLHWSFEYECSKCTIKFQKKITCNRHEKICGTATDLVPCDQCHKHFRSRKLLRNHVYAEHPPPKPSDTEPRIRTCKMCPKQFYCKFELRKHVRWHRKETNVKPYECQICGYKCLEKAMRDRHVARHTGGMKFTCEICHGVYDIEHRKRHSLTHTGERNHQCAECGRLFMLKTHLKSHMLSHSEERKFQCDLCPKVYKRPAKLALHRRSHLVDFLYKCKFCPQGFKAKVSLVKHSLSVHGLAWNASADNNSTTEHVDDNQG